MGLTRDRHLERVAEMMASFVPLKIVRSGNLVCFWANLARLLETKGGKLTLSKLRLDIWISLMPMYKSSACPDIDCDGPSMLVFRAVFNASQFHQRLLMMVSFNINLDFGFMVDVWCWSCTQKEGCPVYPFGHSQWLMFSWNKETWKKKSFLRNEMWMD